MTIPGSDEIRLGSRAIAGALAVLFLFAPASRAEEPETFEEALTVSEVLLDVLVTDRDGNVIVGLGPEDFEVEEKGEEIAVRSAAFYSNRDLLDPTEGSLAEPDPRHFIIFLHDRRRYASELPGILAQQLDFGRESRRWIREEMLPGDWLAIVRYDQRLHIHSDFTRDRKALEEAVTDAASGRSGPEAWPSRAPALGDQGEAPSLLARLPSGKGLRNASKTIYAALELVADASQDILERKILVLFSTGFGRVDSFGRYERERRYYDPMVETLNHRNVAVYAVDTMPVGSEHALADALHQIANETGARYFFSSTSFLIPLRQIAKENNGYYLLSYRRERPAGESGFQKVRVRTRNREFRIRARQGYRYGD